MNWLAPLFLFGAAAIALPIWLHRLQTETPKRQRFASLMLLMQAERRVHVEKRLRYWLLLALRVLFLLLLALAFAKPLWTQPPAALSANSQLQVLLLDSSMSMQQGERWATAVKQANELIAAAAPEDRLMLVSASDELQVLAGPVSATSEGKNGVRNALAKMQVGAAQLLYGGMMNGVESLLAEETQATVLHVISDFQQSALPAQFGDLAPRAMNGRVMQVALHSVNDGVQANWAVNSIERTATGIEVLVQGYNSPERAVAVHLLVNGTERSAQSRTVPAAGNALFQFDKVVLNSGSNRVVAKLDAVDGVVSDDEFFTVLDNTEGQPIPLLSAKPAGVTSKYLDAAFQSSGDRYRLQTSGVDQFDARTLERYRLVLIDDLGALPESLTKALSEYLQKGGAVLAAVGERSLSLKQLPLVNLSLGNAAVVGERATVGAVDVNHAALARAAGLRALSVSRYVPVTADANSRLLAQLDNGAPLLIEQRVGQGRVLLFTSALDNTWNDLPIQPVFVSFLSEASRYLAGDTLIKRAQRVGSLLPLEQATAAGQVIDPKGQSLLSLSDSQRARSVKLGLTGFYEVVTAGSSSWVAVNTVPDESNLLPMSDDELASWQNTLSLQQSAQAASAGGIAKPSGFELWHWLLVVMVLLVLAESLLGNTYVFRRVETPT